MKLRQYIPEELCEKCEKRIDCITEVVDSIPTLVKVGPDTCCVLAKPLTVFVPSANLPYDIQVPSAVEIGSPGTLECAAALTQEELNALIEWGIEKYFDMVLGSQDIKMPKTVAELRTAGDGTNHIVGMIALIARAFMEGNFKIYLKFPETHLHPKAQLGLVEMLRSLLEPPPKNVAL